MLSILLKIMILLIIIIIVKKNNNDSNNNNSNSNNNKSNNNNNKDNDDYYHSVLTPPCCWWSGLDRGNSYCPEVTSTSNSCPIIVIIGVDIVSVLFFYCFLSVINVVSIFAAISILEGFVSNCRLMLYWSMSHHMTHSRYSQGFYWDSISNQYVGWLLLIVSFSEF